MLAVRTFDDLSAVSADDWKGLTERCPDATVFQCKEWLDSWCKTIGSGLRKHIIVAYDDQRPVGIAPLCFHRTSVLGSPHEELRFIADDHSDYNIFIALDGSPAITAALCEAVNRTITTGVSARLREIPQWSVTNLVLGQRRARGSSGIKRTSTTLCPRLQISNNFGGVTNVLRKDSLRRHYAALAKIGPIRVEHEIEAQRALELTEALFEQHVERWQDTPYPSIFLEERHRSFYRSMVPALAASRQVVLSVVNAGNHRVAMHLGLRSGRDLLWYKPSFDPAFRRTSPGETLLKSLIEYARDGGYDALDYTRGDEPFKLRFSSSFDHNVSYEWLPRSISASLYRTAKLMKRAARAALEIGKAHGKSARPEPDQPKRVLLIDPPPTIIAELRLFLGRHELAVDIATLGGASEDTHTHGALEASSVGQTLAAVRALDLEASFSCILPGSASAYTALAALPAEDKIRRKTLLGADATLLQSAAEKCLPAAPSETNESLSIEALCAHGRLVWLHVGGPNGDVDSRDPAFVAAAIGTRAAAMHAKWHGVVSAVWANDRLSDVRPYILRWLAFRSRYAPTLFGSTIAFAEGKNTPAQPE